MHRIAEEDFLLLFQTFVRFLGFSSNLSSLLIESLFCLIGFFRESLSSDSLSEQPLANHSLRTTQQNLTNLSERRDRFV